MIDSPEIVKLAAQPLASLHLIIAKAEIQRAMGPGIGEVMAAVAAQGQAPAGPWLTHHLRMAADTWDFEICVPVARPIVAVGRVTPAEWPAMTVARTVYHGGYEGLGAGWGELMEWIAASAHGNPAAEQA